MRGQLLWITAVILGSLTAGIKWGAASPGQLGEVVPDNVATTLRGGVCSAPCDWVSYKFCDTIQGTKCSSVRVVCRTPMVYTGVVLVLARYTAGGGKRLMANCSMDAGDGSLTSLKNAALLRSDRLLNTWPASIRGWRARAFFSLGAKPMRYVYFLVVLALTSVVDVLIAREPSSIPSSAERKGHSRAVRRPPQAVICGPNALYMFLKAHNRPVSADEFFRELDPGDQGLSLTEMRDASTRYGLLAEIRRCTYEQLIGGCSLPVIALLHQGVQIAGPRIGHYVLIVDADSDGVTLVDGSSGERKRCLRDAFCRSWKGYVVLPVGDKPDWLPLLAMSIAFWMLVGWFILQANRSGSCLNGSTEAEVPTDASAR